MKNIIMVRLFAWLMFAIFEIILQVLFRIWSCVGREFFLSAVDLIQQIINLHWIPTPSLLQSKWKIAIYEKKQNTVQLRNQKTWIV